MGTGDCLGARSPLREIAAYAAQVHVRGELTPDQACRGATAEVGLMLRIASVTAGGRIALAERLTAQLSNTWAALRGGRISLSSATAIAEETQAVAPTYSTRSKPGYYPVRTS